MTGYPSSPGALRSCMLNSVALIPSGVGTLLSSEFSSLVIHGELGALDEEGS